jgi:hypothetical protein
MKSKKPAAKAAPKLPALKKGETYVGITLHDDKPHHLILLPGDESKKWADAVAWAKKKGGVLPSRIDAIVLFEKAKAKFEQRWYWLGQEYAGHAGYAWVADFSYGGQGNYLKSYGCRCRAVRRVAI